MTGGMGNPAPLGLFAFGSTTALLMYVEMDWVEHHFQYLVYGYALFLGGLCQILVGIFELIHGSSFPFAVFCGYGAYWMAKAVTWLEAANTKSDFYGSKHPKGSCAFFIQWGLLTTVFWIFTFRKNACLIVTFGLLVTTFFLLAAHAGSGSHEVQLVAGYFGFATALSAFYTGIAELVNEEWGWHVLPGLQPMLRPVEIDPKSMAARLTYDKNANTLLLFFTGLQVSSLAHVSTIKDAVVAKIQSVAPPSGKVHVIANYKDVVIADDVIEAYKTMVASLQKDYYLSVKRFESTAFGGKNQESVSSTTLLDSMQRS